MPLAVKLKKTWYLNPVDTKRMLGVGPALARMFAQGGSHHQEGAEHFDLNRPAKNREPCEGSPEGHPPEASDHRLSLFARPGIPGTSHVKLPRDLPEAEMCRALERPGFEFIGQTGSHWLGAHDSRVPFGNTEN